MALSHATFEAGLPGNAEALAVQQTIEALLAGESHP